MIERMQRCRYLTVLQSAIADVFVSRHHPPLGLAVAAVALRGSEEVLTGPEKPPKLTGGISSDVLKFGLLALTINRSTQIEHVEGGERPGELENAC